MCPRKARPSMTNLLEHNPFVLSLKVRLLITRQQPLGPNKSQHSSAKNLLWWTIEVGSKSKSMPRDAHVLTVRLTLYRWIQMVFEPLCSALKIHHKLEGLTRTHSRWRTASFVCPQETTEESNMVLLNNACTHELQPRANLLILFFLVWCVLFFKQKVI